MESQQKTPCPNCQSKGISVAEVTVRAMAVDEAKDKLRHTSYQLCTQPDCPIAYFAAEGDPTLTTADIKVPLHFKTDAHKRYTCYCNKITDDEVKQVVSEKKLDKMQAIIQLLRGEVQSDCIHKNPFGHCCTDRFHHVIEQAKADVVKGKER